MPIFNFTYRIYIIIIYTCLTLGTAEPDVQNAMFENEPTSTNSNRSEKEPQNAIQNKLLLPNNPNISYEMKRPSSGRTLNA